MKDEATKKSRSKLYWGIAGLSIAVIIVLGFALTGYNPFAGDDEVTPTTVGASTFELKSAVDGEDVSSFATMDIWVPKSGATFDDGYEDITALTKNFERDESGKDADDISIDLSDHDYVWAEIVGNSVWQNTFHLIFPSGANGVHRYNVHHVSSAVPFNIFTKNTGAAVTVNHSTSGNFTGVLDAVIDSMAVADCHYGDDWDLDATAFGELTATQQEFYWDESNWCDQWVTYDPTLDTVNEYERDFERITGTFALKLVFNVTINVTDGAATQINVTVGKGFPIDTLISGANLYFVWYEGFNFLDEPYAFDYELSYAADIMFSTAYSGRVNVPASLSSLTDWVTYNEIGLVAA